MKHKAENLVPFSSGFQKTKQIGIQYDSQGVNSHKIDKSLWLFEVIVTSLEF